MDFRRYPSWTATYVDSGNRILKTLRVSLAWTLSILKLVATPTAEVSSNSRLQQTLERLLRSSTGENSRASESNALLTLSRICLLANAVDPAPQDVDLILLPWTTMIGAVLPADIVPAAVVVTATGIVVLVAITMMIAPVIDLLLAVPWRTILPLPLAAATMTPIAATTLLRPIPMPTGDLLMTDLLETSLRARADTHEMVVIPETMIVVDATDLLSTECAKWRETLTTSHEVGRTRLKRSTGRYAQQ